MLVDVDGKKTESRYNNAFVNPIEFVADDFDFNKLKTHIGNSITLLKELMNKNLR